MLTHNRLSNEYAHTFGGASIQAAVCGNLRLVNKDKVQRFLLAQQNYLSYTVYDEVAFRNGKQAGIAQLKNASEANIRSLCSGYATTIDQITIKLVQDYQSTAAARNRDLVGLSTSLIGSSNYLPSQSLMQLPVPTLEPITPNSINTVPLYNADDCIGSMVNGMCYGSVISKAKPIGYCRGIVVSGQCSGAVTDY